MSIETALANLTSAIQENTAVQMKVLAVLTSSAKPATTSTKTEKPAGNLSKSVSSGMKTEKAVTAKDLLDLYGRYLGSATDKAQKARLADIIRPMLDHFGVSKISEITPENYTKAWALGEKLMAALKEGGVDAAEKVDLGLSNEEDEDEDEDEEDEDDVF